MIPDHAPYATMRTVYRVDCTRILSPWRKTFLSEIYATLESATDAVAAHKEDAWDIIKLTFIHRPSWEQAMPRRIVVGGRL